jgi:ABC-type molybdate transport system substrate-binding protein
MGITIDDFYSRWHKSIQWITGSTGAYNTLTRLDIKKSPPPFNLTIYKGVKNIILSRHFAEFVINDPVAKIFRDWTKDMSIPDEHFIHSLCRIQDTNPIEM